MSDVRVENLPAGQIEIAGKRYMRDARGALVPAELVKPQHALEDQMVRKVMAFADDLSAQIGRFKAHTFDDLAAFQSLLEEQYGGKAGGAKGNVTFTSYDGMLKVQVQIADRLTFGAELQVAKSLIDECLTEWGAESHAAIRAIVTRAFDVGKEGQIDRNALFQLRRVDIDDHRWRQAMAAIADAIRIVGTVSYIRFYRRPAPEAPWQAVTIDLAAA
jgi:hypothetical protein